MRRERIGRRRFVALTAGLGAAGLAGCADDAGSDEPEPDESGDESDGEEPDRSPEDEDEEDGELPALEGTTVSIEVVDPAGTAVPGAMVTVTGGEYNERAFETDADGTVVLREIEPGEYAVTTTDDEGEDRAEFTLEAGEEVEVTLELPAGPEDEAGR